MRATLLPIPGVLNDASVWADSIADLGRHTNAQVRIVLPVQESIGAMAAAAWQQVADVPADAPLVIGGFSLGGYVALEMLARPVRRVHGVALVSTSARPESAEAAALREKTIAAMARDFPRVVEGLVRHTTHEPSAALVGRLRAMMLGVGADTAMRQNRAAMGRLDHRAALAGLALPVKVLCGQQDRVTPPALSQELAQLLPLSQLELVEGAGHMLPCERPQAVALALRTLLSIVESQPKETTSP